MCVNNLEQLVQGRTRQCIGWDWTRDLQSQVQRPNHYATKPRTPYLSCVCQLPASPNESTFIQPAAAYSPDTNGRPSCFCRWLLWQSGTRVCNDLCDPDLGCFHLFQRYSVHRACRSRNATMRHTDSRWYFVRFVSVLTGREVVGGERPQEETATQAGTFARPDVQWPRFCRCWFVQESGFDGVRSSTCGRSSPAF